MSKWDDAASRLQDGVRAAEQRNSAFVHYDEDEVARAVIHTRQDVVLLASYLSSLNSQIMVVKWLLAVIAVAAVILAYHDL